MVKKMISRRNFILLGGITLISVNAQAKFIYEHKAEFISWEDIIATLSNIPSLHVGKINTISISQKSYIELFKNIETAANNAYYQMQFNGILTAESKLLLSNFNSAIRKDYELFQLENYHNWLISKTESALLHLALKSTG